MIKTHARLKVAILFFSMTDLTAPLIEPDLEATIFVAKGLTANDDSKIVRTS